jgi:hypothetical protein
VAIARSGKAESDNGDYSESKASSGSYDSLSSSDSSQESSGSYRVASPEQKRRAKLRQHVVNTVMRLHGQAGRIERAGARHRRRRIEVYREKERTKQLYETVKQLRMWKLSSNSYQLLQLCWIERRIPLLDEEFDLHIYRNTIRNGLWIHLILQIESLFHGSRESW